MVDGAGDHTPRWLVAFAIGLCLLCRHAKGATPDEIRASIARGTEFLLRVQNANGSWGSPTHTKDLNIYAPVPGAHHAFRSAVTSLCLSSLIELRSDDPRIEKAIDRGEAWLVRELPRLRRATPDALYNIWGHAYSLTALAQLYQRHAGEPKRQQELLDLMQSQLERLVEYESVDGGWGYYDFRARTRRPTTDSTPFMTAAVLISMRDASRVGLQLPEKLVARAVASIRRQQKPDFSYLYGEYLKDVPMSGINRPGGSLGRSQACNIALRRFGDTRITDDVLQTCLERLVRRNGWLDMGRKRPVPHESHMQVAGYFYYFGHFYAGLCLEDLPASKRAPLQPKVAQLIVDRQEKDGSWWDFPLYDYHRQYGTAFAIMTLLRCLPGEHPAILSDQRLSFPPGITTLPSR